MNRRLADLGLERQPAKTFIGRIAHGFEFLGYHFTPDGLGIAEATAQRFVERATRLYEHERRGAGGRRRSGCTFDAGAAGRGEAWERGRAYDCRSWRRA